MVSQTRALSSFVVVSVSLGKAGWTCILTGRRQALLEDVAKEIEDATVIAGDIVSSLS